MAATAAGGALLAGWANHGLGVVDGAEQEFDILGCEALDGHRSFAVMGRQRRRARR